MRNAIPRNNLKHTSIFRAFTSLQKSYSHYLYNTGTSIVVAICPFGARIKSYPHRVYGVSKSFVRKLSNKEFRKLTNVNGWYIRILVDKREKLDSYVSTINKPKTISST